MGFIFIFFTGFGYREKDIIFALQFFFLLRPFVKKKPFANWWSFFILLDFFPMLHIIKGMPSIVQIQCVLI